MDIFYISDTQVILNPMTANHAVDLIGDGENDVSGDAYRFMWIDITHDEVEKDAEAWRDQVEKLTGVRIFDLHLKDICNRSHPSNFDATQDYELVVFQKLALNGEGEESSAINPENSSVKKKMPAVLHRLQTQPVSFLLIGNALITVRANYSRTIETMRSRLLSFKPKDSNNLSSKLPASPEDLMLRLLNAMVDQYLDLRQPLTNQLDRWQHALLDPRKPFNNWVALLDSRVELRKLEHLCEEQYDALQELRDHFVDTYDGSGGKQSRAKDLLLVRTNDVMEHINRVLNHTRRLEASLESSVQIHFAAVSHKTSEIMRILTVITALFMPLTLITGIFGMNFAKMPWINEDMGFKLVLGLMGFTVVIFLLAMRLQGYLEGRGQRNE
ncbi:magnesium transporter CorA family protein [Undibacterium amnicola]|uniref:Magnesium transporter CorA family protein n=1 Tax=Undibacterium amnicola TaxID=1834038 RepID=A0ABR6XW08_9BURK|nr:magnesium transporter CorA family protein [Undibacterium amnicola]MBC3833558.1 magnesium transporter CorA family protein [Undibacterium amnicola]